MPKKAKPANNLTKPEFFKVLKKVARKTKTASAKTLKKAHQS